MKGIAIIRAVAMLGFALALGAGCVGRIGDEVGSFPTGSGGSPTTSSAGGTGASGGTSGAAASGASGLPCDVATLLAGKCATCHGATPLPGVPMSLATYPDLTAPAKSEARGPSRSLAIASASIASDAAEDAKDGLSIA